MGVKIGWKNFLRICIILLIFFSNISFAQSESLYDLVVEKKDIINENLVEAKKAYPFLFSLVEDRHLVMHSSDGQVVGLILSDGKITEIVRGEPEETTIDIFTDMGTIESIEGPDDFIGAIRDDRIKVKYRDPFTSNPIASTAALVGSVFAFGFFYYYTGNFYKTKKSLRATFSMIGLIRQKEKAGIEKEMATGRVLFSILGWEGKGYKPKNEYARLLIGHSYLLKCKFTPLKEFKQAKIKLNYDDSKLKIDDSDHNVELPGSKIYRISTKTEGLPELQAEATDFIMIHAEWEDGLKEEGLIKIPVMINRNVYDGISYTAGNAIKWIGEIIALGLIIMKGINELINLILS